VGILGLTHPSTPKVLQTKERSMTPYYFAVFALDSHLSLSRSFGRASISQLSLIVTLNWSGDKWAKNES